MIRGIFHRGSGLGNMLHRYVGARVLALDSGHEFGMVAPELFKGKSFMNLDMGNTLSDYHIEEPSGKVIPHTTDPVVDGEFQGEKYFMHRIDEVREWLAVEPLYDPYEESEHPHEPICVINFRGGEYVGIPDLFLPQDYWDRAIDGMIENDPEIRFLVVTDDIVTAKKFFPNFEITHSRDDWRLIRYADHLILSNSSFAILPALLNENDPYIIAPKFWAGHNKGTWQLPENEYKKFTYI